MYFDITSSGVLWKCEMKPREKLVKLPDKVKIIGEYAFKGCDSLQRVCLPPQLIEIMYGAFHGCFRLAHIGTDPQQEGICLPEGLTRLAGDTFYGCHAIRMLHIPSTLQSCGLWDLEGCVNLEQITIRRKDDRVYQFVLDRHMRRPGSFLDMLVNRRYDDARYASDTACSMQKEENLRMFLAIAVSGFDDGRAETLLAEHTELFWLYLLTNTELLHSFIDDGTLTDMLQSERLLECVPEEIFEQLILLANERKAYDLQLLLMNRKKRSDSLQDMQKRLRL